MEFTPWMVVMGELEYENFNAAGAKITFKEKCASWVMPKER
jgi:hypothetical protein